MQAAAHGFGGHTDARLYLQLQSQCGATPTRTVPTVNRRCFLHQCQQAALERRCKAGTAHSPWLTGASAARFASHGPRRKRWNERTAEPPPSRSESEAAPAKAKDESPANDRGGRGAIPLGNGLVLPDRFRSPSHTNSHSREYSESSQSR